MSKFVWFEYVSKDIAKAQGFFGELFNWGVKKVPMPGGDYAMISAKETRPTSGSALLTPVAGELARKALVARFASCGLAGGFEQPIDATRQGRDRVAIVRLRGSPLWMARERRL